MNSSSIPTPKTPIQNNKEKNIVKFQLRMARKMFRKAQKKLVKIYGEDESESDSD